MNKRPILSLKKATKLDTVSTNPEPNTTKKQNKFYAIRNSINQLCKRFPDLFNVHKPKPLKVGIRDDIITSDLELTKTACRKALGAYTSSDRYLKSVIDNQHRYDLNGNSVEDITEEHKQNAKMRLALKAKRKIKQVNDKS